MPRAARISEFPKFLVFNDHKNPAMIRFSTKSSDFLFQGAVAASSLLRVGLAISVPRISARSTGSRSPAPGERHKANLVARMPHVLLTAADQADGSIYIVARRRRCRRQAGKTRVSRRGARSNSFASMLRIIRLGYPKRYPSHGLVFGLSENWRLSH